MKCAGYVFMLMLMIVSLASAQEDLNALRQTGLNLIKQGKLSEAETTLLQAISIREDSESLYLLAVTYAKRRDPSECLSYSERSLRGAPPLKKEFVDGAKKLIGWAKAIIDRSGSKGTYTMSKDPEQGKDLAKLNAMEKDYAKPEYDATFTKTLVIDPCSGSMGPEASRCRMESEVEVIFPDAPNVSLP